MDHAELKLKQFSAHVKVDGKALECHSTWVDKKARHVSCWIASESGKKFSVVFEKDETKRFCAAVLSMDGSEVADDIYLRDDDETEWEFMKTSKGMGRRFKFAPLNVIVSEGETTVDETVAGSKIMEKVGVIEVAVYSAIKNGYCFDGDSSSESDSDETPTRSTKRAPVHSVPEVLTKGKVVHQIGFEEEEVMKPGDPAPVASSSRRQSRRRPQKVPTYHIVKTKLLAKFTFRYRPLDVLQRAGIAPRDPTPPPPEPELVDEPVDELVDELMDDSDGAPVDEHVPGTVDGGLPPPPVADTSEIKSPSNKRKASPFGVEDEKKSIIPNENDNSEDEDEDREREKLLLAELESIRNKRKGTDGGSPRKRFKQEDRPAFVQGEVIDLT